MRFLVIPERDYRPSLIVDVVPDASDEAVRNRFREDLYDKGTSTGILFDANTCVLFHDTFSDMSPESIAIVSAVSTTTALARVDGGRLEERVKSWLTLLTERWHDALPAGDDGAPFIMNVVPAASGSTVRMVTAA